MPKIVDHNLRRSALARAAVEAIAETGLDGVKLADIARTAGVTTGTLAHYFPDKDALLAAALEEVCARLLRKIAEPGSGVVLTEIATVLPMTEESRKEWRVWLAYWGRAPFSERLRQIHQQYYLDIETALCDHLGALVPEPQPLAAAIIAAVDGTGTRATLEPESWPPKRQEALLTTLLAPLFTRLNLPLA